MSSRFADDKSGWAPMFPRKVGSAWEVFAPAKLNLYLDVLGHRPDGFHELETLMVPVRIYDGLRWTSDCCVGDSDVGDSCVRDSWVGDSPIGAGGRLRIQSLLPHGSSTDDRTPDFGESSQNLVLRAAELLARSAGIEPHGTFLLSKRIPVQAGMGGGSSDAAAALLLANAAWGIGRAPEQLASLALELGSDVPFFLQSSPAVCRGRGEHVESISGLPHLHFVIVKPPVGLSTAEVFSRMNRSEFSDGTIETSLTQLINSLRTGALMQAGSWMRNALEPAAAELTEWIDRLRQALIECGGYAQFMTGSGSAYVGVMRSAVQARIAAHLLSNRGLGTVLATSSCSLGTSCA
jgi:4-diphosphocytidyl-2-C-methyl-D-erythritol kinase